MRSVPLAIVRALGWALLVGALTLCFAVVALAASSLAYAADPPASTACFRVVGTSNYGDINQLVTSTAYTFNFACSLPATGDVVSWNGGNAGADTGSCTWPCTPATFTETYGTTGIYHMCLYDRSSGGTTSYCHDWVVNPNPGTVKVQNISGAALAVEDSPSPGAVWSVSETPTPLSVSCVTGCGTSSDTTAAVNSMDLDMVAGLGLLVFFAAAQLVYLWGQRRRVSG